MRYLYIIFTNFILKYTVDLLTLMSFIFSIHSPVSLNLLKRTPCLYTMFTVHFFLIFIIVTYCLTNGIVSSTLTMSFKIFLQSFCYQYLHRQPMKNKFVFASSLLFLFSFPRCFLRQEYKDNIQENNISFMVNPLWTKILTH